MSQVEDEGRAARIQKYKEERRKQLTAKTATLFSANVTERTPRKPKVRALSEDVDINLKSSSEVNLNTSPTSVPIRTTRASRLRAAATSQTSPQKSSRSSSVASLLDDPKMKTYRNSKATERDKNKLTNRKLSREEKENVKSTSTTSVVHKDIGAIKSKPKHSNNVNKLDKDKKILVTSPKRNKSVAIAVDSIATKKEDIRERTTSIDSLNLTNNEKPSSIVNEIIADVLADEDVSENLVKEEFDHLFNNLLNDANVQNVVKLNSSDDILNLEIDSSFNSGLKLNSHKETEVPKEELKNVHNAKLDVVPVKNGPSSLLGIACVRNVERFSELLGNLCSTGDTELVFEDILADYGLNGEDETRITPACAPPCRRTQPTATRAPAATPKLKPSEIAATNVSHGSPTKRKPSSCSQTSHPETELPYSSSKISPKTTYNLSNGIKTSSNSSRTNLKLNKRRNSSEVLKKTSCIPQAKKIHSSSLVKQALTKGVQEKSTDKFETVRCIEKSVSDTETHRRDRRLRAEKDSKNVSEKYHNSKKRLTRLEYNSPKSVKDARNYSPKTLLNGALKCDPTIKSEEIQSKNLESMSTLHERVRPLAATSRLSQEMDSLAVLTKETLDRVNKLSNTLASPKLNINTTESQFDKLFASTSEQSDLNNCYNYNVIPGKSFQNRGVNERLKDIDTAAQRLIDFERQSSMLSDLNNDTSSHKRRFDLISTSNCHTPVSILKRKSIHEDNVSPNATNHSIASPPVTFSPSVIEPRNSRSDNRQRQGILKKRRSLDESQVARRRSCSPEVSFAEDSSSDTSKPILKNRRSSMEDVVRNRSPDGQIQGILKRKTSREEDHPSDDLSHESPEPQGILKRKSSSSSSTASSHVSIAQAVLLAAAGGAELVDDDKEAVRPILKKKSFSEERPCLDISISDTPKPILKKKSLEHDEHDFELPKKPILKVPKKLSSDEGNASSFDSSEDDRSSRRPSLLRSRTSDHSGSECETAVRPILKQRGSSLTRERSQSPRPRLSFCADNEASIHFTNISSDPNRVSVAGPSRLLNVARDPEDNTVNVYPSAVIRRRNSRPKDSLRSNSLVCDVNHELLSILNNRRIQVDENCQYETYKPWENQSPDHLEHTKGFPSIASRIQSMEQALTKESLDPLMISKGRNRDRDRHKTQPVTIDEMRFVKSCLEPGQSSFQAFGPISSSFPSHPGESGTSTSYTDNIAEESYRDPFSDLVQTLDSPPFGASSFIAKNTVGANGDLDCDITKDDSYGEATFLDFEIRSIDRRQSTLEDIEKEVDKVCEVLDEDTRAIEQDEGNHGDGDNWSVTVSCDSGVCNRASSRDSGPHSGEELGSIECQEIRENHATNSSSNDWSTTSLEHGLMTMDRQRKSTEVEDMRPEDEPNDDEDVEENRGFALGLVKSNSVVARASMWQQLQQQAKGTPKPLLKHPSKARESSVGDRFKTQPIQFCPDESAGFSLSQSKSTANVLDRDEDAKLDEDDPAKLSLSEKMKMFNTKLTHKPPVAGLPKPKEERNPRASRLKTMPVLASQVKEAMETNERMSKSLNQNDMPRNSAFQMKMELFRSASAKNTSLEYIMKSNPKFRSLDLDDDSPPEGSDRMITPEVRGILKTGSTFLPHKPNLTKGESSEGLKDEGIDSSSDDDSSSTASVSSFEKSCSSTECLHHYPEREILATKQRRFQARKNNKLKNSKTDSDLTRVLQTHDARKIQLPGANELQERFSKAKNSEVKIPLLGKLAKKSPEEKIEVDDSKNPRYKRLAKKLDEPIQLGKLRRPPENVFKNVEERPPQVLKISALNQEAKNKFFGIEPKKEKSIEELAAAVRKFIPPVSKSMTTHVMEVGGSGSDGESSGGREVRHITTRRHRPNVGGVQRSATNADMPNRGTIIAERLAALQASGANDWRARVCRLSPEKEDTKAIERAKNRINDNLNSAVDDKKKIHIEDNELGPNILADRRNKLETAAQGWRKRVPQTDANLFTVAGRLERDKVPVVNNTPPLTPPPVPTPASPVIPTPASPGIPTPNKFRSRKVPLSPTNGFTSGPLRSASCAVVSAVADKPKEVVRNDRESFKRSHSVSESISRLDEKDENSFGAEKSGSTVRIPKADDETFHAFYTPVLEKREKMQEDKFDFDLDAIDSGSRQLLSNDFARRAKREKKNVASRNPLKALAARTDIKEEYSPIPSTIREQYIKEKATANCGLAAEALAALATKEDFSNVTLRSAATTTPTHGTKAIMLMQVKGRRRVQTRLVEPVHSNVNCGDCFILVTPDQVYLYMGVYANVIERNRSTDIALHINNTKDLGCKNSNGVITIDEQSKSFSNKHWIQFWSLLGVKDNIEQYKVIETGSPDEDEIYESCIIQTNMCYEVMDDELVPIKEYWGQCPKIAMLHQSKTIVFDFGSEMYIWYGKNVPLESRRRAAQLAQELFDEGYNYEDCHINPVNAAGFQGARDENTEQPTKTAKSRPEWAILSKVTQHMETILFREKFVDWPDYTRVIRVKPQENKSNSMEIAPCDAEEMCSNDYQDPDLILEGSHVGRGTHYYDKESMRHFEIKTKSVCKWVIQEYDYQKVENASDIGDFFSADSYIIRWEYIVNATGRELNGKPSKFNVTGRDRCSYFCWQGKDASSNEKGAAALLTVELDREKGPQIRVAQGNEPPAFLNLFQGNVVIHQGKKGQDKSRYKLFVTRGNLSNEAYLLQVPCSVRQLRSRGSLLLVDTEKGCLYIWHGSRSLKHTKNIAIELANKLIARESGYLFGSKVSNIKINEVKEGEEPKDVLEALGGCNKQYYNSVLSGGKDSGSDITPRLFHFTDLGGQFEANEVLSPLRHEHLVTPFPFDQKELYAASQPALFLLDDGKYVWLWQGWWPRGEDGELEPAERNTGVGAFAARWQAMRAAALKTAEAYWKISRGTRPDVRVVAAGLEPQIFTDLFDTWKEYDDAAEANIEHGFKSGEILSGACELSRLTSCDAILPLAALQRRPLPEHVDPMRLERHLSSPDFVEAFGMTKEEFSILPAWKQTNMKKDVGLF